jgi:hypothetical protein
MKVTEGHLARAVLFIAPLLAGTGPAHAGAQSADFGGPATLSGRAFLTAMGGEAVTCAGREVTIAPNDQQPLPVNGNGMVGAADRAAAFSDRRAICDNQGRFAFTGLAARDWTIRTSIRWDVRAKQSIRHLGGDVVQRVTLRAGDNSVVLNDHDLSGQSSEAPRMAASAP